MLIITRFTILTLQLTNKDLDRTSQSRPSDDFWGFCRTPHAPKFCSYHSAPDSFRNIQNTIK